MYAADRKTPVGSKELEFDVMANALDDKSTILVGECKWQAADHADRLLAQLKNKAAMSPVTRGKNVVYALFLKEKALSEADCAIMYPEDVLGHLPESP